MFRSKNQLTASFFEDRRTVDSVTGCWVWAAYRQSGGYGQFNLDNKPTLAHRASWSFYNKSAVPEGLCVLHTCDNPPCINPAHLFLGTARDNVADCINKNRHLKGFCKGHIHGRKKRLRKLTDEQVREIRATRYSQELLKDVALRYGVTPACVSTIRRGKRKKLST